MSLPKHEKTPHRWTEEELEAHARQSLGEFVDRRLKEPRDRYTAHLQERKAAIHRLFKLLAPLDPDNPDPESVRRVLVDDDLFNALRYVAGPPVSSDDLGVLVLRAAERLNKTRLRRDDRLVQEVLKLICRLSDPVRFPWIAERRAARLHELKTAIRATAALHATQMLQTERRGYGRLLEKKLEHRLTELDYKKAKTPARGRVRTPKDWPLARTFYRECTVYGRKADLLIGLTDGRIVAVEAKDSASVLNSVKRVLNDTAAKARHWHTMAGREIVPVALLSGVFGLENLTSAQDSGLYLVWGHELDAFVDWLDAQK